MIWHHSSKAGVGEQQAGKPINDRRSRQQEVTPAGTSMRYEASFKPQSGGMEQTFRLDAQQYHALTVAIKVR